MGKKRINVKNPVTIQIRPVSDTKSLVIVNSEHEILVETADESGNNPPEDIPRDSVTNPAGTE